MIPEQNVGGRDRKARAVLAVVFAAVAASALGRGNRSVGLLAAAGALGLALNAVTCFCSLNAALGVDTTDGE